MGSTLVGEHSGTSIGGIDDRQELILIRYFHQNKKKRKALDGRCAYS
jgi:hypothetical protein